MLTLILGGFLNMVLKNSYFVFLLLSLEVLVLGIYSVLSLVSSDSGEEMSFILYFLVVSVCEGALGLSLIMQLVRSFGEDFLKGSTLIM